MLGRQCGNASKAKEMTGAICSFGSDIYNYNYNSIDLNADGDKAAASTSAMRRV
jgi:hypothetical protein